MPSSAAWARCNPTSKDRPQSCPSDSSRPTRPWLSSKQPIVQALDKPNLCLSENALIQQNMRQKNGRCETFLAAAQGTSRPTRRSDCHSPYAQPGSSHFPATTPAAAGPSRPEPHAPRSQIAQQKKPACGPLRELRPQQ